MNHEGYKSNFSLEDKTRIDAKTISKSVRRENTNNFPVDRRRKLNVHKTFRRRPGRLLNLLCTLFLRPLSTGLVLAHLNINSLRNKFELLANQVKGNVDVFDEFSNRCFQ